ncbi:hypothetical protein R3W88_017174 [Solanum pinnatisectum]|uniref:Uncharacterized protein n=1 Tax=Solanum pinnatisectum TaxID=50273 RepID=A0AAV9KZT3_9SOLN|nr:hypothetical protein R3W88_017174 [Solanum pinnatisectum]
MERFIMGQGTFSTKPVILFHVYGYFVRFANEEERDKRKEWVPITNKEQGCDTKQVEENQQEQTTKDNDGTTQGQGEWQTVRHRTSSRRDYRNIQGERRGHGPIAGVMTYEEGQMNGEGSGEMKRPSIQPSIHDSNIKCKGL